MVERIRREKRRRRSYNRREESCSPRFVYRPQKQKPCVSIDTAIFRPIKGTVSISGQEIDSLQIFPTGKNLFAISLFTQHGACSLVINRRRLFDLIDLLRDAYRGQIIEAKVKA